MKNRKKNTIVLFALAMLGIAFASCRQEKSENPRGVFRMTKIIGRGGEPLDSPFDQYKICTDSITWMVTIDGNRVSAIDNDHMVFDCTGQNPDPDDPYRSRIYAWDGKSFRLDWWSTYTNHPIFPQNDWCTEIYEADNYSTFGRAAIDLLTQPALSSQSGLEGHWTFVTAFLVDMQANVESEVDSILAEDSTRVQAGLPFKNYLNCLALNKDYCLHKSLLNSTIHPFTRNDGKTFEVGAMLRGYLYEKDNDYLITEIVNCDDKHIELWKRDYTEGALINKSAQQMERVLKVLEELNVPDDSE